MRTYKEPKRIDKPRVREPGIVNPDYVNRIAASYHQKNNVIPDGSSNNEMDPSGTNHHCDDISSPKGSEDGAMCTIQEDEITPGPEKEDVEIVQCKDLDNGLGLEVSPMSDDGACDNEREMETEEKTVLSPPPPPDCRSEDVDQKMNNVIVSEKTDIQATSPHSNNSTTRKKKTTKPKPKQSENSDTKKPVKAKPGTNKKKTSSKVSKSKDTINNDLKDTIHPELNGTEEFKDSIDVVDPATHDPSPPKKKKSIKSLPSKKSEKKLSKSKEKVAINENNVEDLHITEKDDLDTSSKSDASSPRVSKRTPKRNRKYHSEEESEWPVKEESESGKKKDSVNKSSVVKKSPIRKRKLLFEDDDIEEEEEVVPEAPPAEEIVKKPVKKRRKKVEEKSTTEIKPETIAETETTTEKAVVEGAEAKSENVQKKVKKPRKKPAAKTPKTAVNENIPPTDIANGVNNVSLDKTSQEEKVLATEHDSIEQKSTEDNGSVDTKSNTTVCKKVETSDVKKKKKTIKKPKVAPTDELKKNNDVTEEEGNSSVVNETNENICDKPEVKPLEVKKKSTKKKKSIVKNQENVNDEKKDINIKDENVEKDEDLVKEVKEEIESEVAESLSNLPAIPVVKRPPVVITCQHCGHVSHSKGANTRHLRKCVVSILKGEGPMSPTRASSSGIESEDKTVGPTENGEDIKDVKTTILLQNQEIKKIETGTAGEAQYRCQHCTYATPKRAMLARHMRTHGIYVCLRCTFISDTHDSLKDHCHREHKDRTDFKLCRKCSRYVKCTEVTLEKHMEECLGPVPFICNHCSKEFKYESSLKSHIIRHNPDAPKRFHCEKCSYESNYKANLKKHMANIHGEKVKHVRCVHPDCEKMFYTEDSMRRHLKWHSEERPFKCPNCDKRFKTNTALRGHKVIHDPSRPFKCNINDCTKDFRSKKHLKNHQEEFHQIADKKFMCSQEACTFAFFKRSHLERHLITHTGERKFGCRICGRAFRHADNLKIHMRQHTNEKPVKCDLCDFACRQKSSLQYHLRKFHNIIPPSKEASNHVVAIDGVRKPASATVGSANGRDSNGSKLQDKKPLSPINRSQNPMDLYEFKSDDEMDSDALLPLFQDKSLKSFRVNNVDKSENEKPVVMENKGLDQDTALDMPASQESEDKPTGQENDLSTGLENVKEEQLKPETKKKKPIKKKKKPKVVKEEEKDEEEVVKSNEEKQNLNIKDDPDEVTGQSDIVAEDLSEVVTEVVKPKPKGKTKGKKKATPKGTSPKAAAPKGTSPKAASPKGTKSTSPKSTTPKSTTPKSTTPKSTTPKSTTPKSTTPKASTPKSGTPKSPKAAISKTAVSKAAKGKKAPAPKKGRKVKPEQEEEPPVKAETKQAPKRSPRTKAAASKKSPGGKKKPKAKKKKKEPIVAEDLDETDEYREDDDEEEVEKEKVGFDLPSKDQSKQVKESEGEQELGDPAFVDVIKYVEEHSMGNLSESDKPEQPQKEIDEEPLPAVEESVEKSEEDVEENALDMTAAEKPKEVEDMVTETVTEPTVAVAEPLTDIQSKVDEDSDRMSSGIDTDFEEELKPPPAPRPPPVVDSDEGDIESGPEDIDTPGRDFESTPPKSVANSENIHSVQSHSGGEPRLESDFGDSISQPYRRSESQPDSGSEVKRDHDPLDALAVSISKTEPDDLSKPTPLADGVASTVVTGPTSGDFGGSQSESTMPEVDKEYLGQYLQQFDSTTRSEDEVSRLDRLEPTADRSIDIPPTPQDKDLPPLNLSATAPPLNLTTTPEIPPEEIQPVQGTDMSNKRMEILECDRQHENHYQPSRSVSPLRPSERIPDNVYDSLSAITSYIPTPTPTPTTRETPVIRQTENIFPPVTATTSTTTTSTSSFMRFTENDALLQRQRMATPFLAQSDPNALQNLHRMADSALASHSNSASSLLRRPTTVPPREDMFPGPTAVTAQTMARNPFNSWAGVAGQDVRPAHWSQTPYLQRDRPANSTSSPLFSKDNYLSGREFMFDPSRRSVAERNMFPGLTQSTTRPELPHETFPMERFDFGYFGSHGYPAAPSLQEYTRTQCGTTQKSLEERYRQTASGITDFSRAFPQTSTSEMFSSINMNTSFNLDKYMYNREPIYHPQHMGDSTNSPFLPHGVAPQHTMFDRDYPPRGFYQNSPYSFVNSMNDKQYAAAAAASAKLTHPTGSGVTQERDFVPRPNTGAAAAPDNQIQDPYRNPLLYNMMNRYTFE